MTQRSLNILWAGGRCLRMRAHMRWRASPTRKPTTHGRRRLPDTHCGQPPRRKRGAVRRVADIGMTKKLLNQPGIHTLICQAVARRVAEHMRVYCQIQVGQPSGLANYVLQRVDRQRTPPRSVSKRYSPVTCCRSFRKARSSSRSRLWMLSLLPLTRATCRTPGSQVHLRPAHIDGFPGAQPVPVDKAQKHLIAERIPTALTGGVEQAVRFVRAEIAAILYFRVFARGAAGWHPLDP